MKGMEMMLRSFGFDPDEMKKQFEEAKQNAEKYVVQVEARLGAMEKQLTELIAAVEKISLQMQIIVPIDSPMTVAVTKPNAVAEKE